MSPKPLAVEVHPGVVQGQQIIQLNGELMRESVFRFEEKMRENKKASPAVTILDMRAVEHVDSAGLGAIVMAHVSHQRAGRKLALVGVNERVAKLLTIAGLDPVLTTFDSVEAAQGAFA